MLLMSCMYYVFINGSARLYIDVVVCVDHVGPLVQHLRSVCFILLCWIRVHA